MYKKTLLVMVLFLLTACARTIVSMDSSPTGAQVFINGGIYRYTPFTVDYSNAHGKSVEFIMKKYGFKTLKGFINKDGEIFVDGNNRLPSKNGIYFFDMEKRWDEGE